MIKAIIELNVLLYITKHVITVETKHDRTILNNPLKSTLFFKYFFASHNCNNICTISAISVANAAPYKLYLGIKIKFNIISTKAPIITAFI